MPKTESAIQVRLLSPKNAMPIAIRYSNEARSDLSVGGDFVVLCDQCGKEIDAEAPGNTEMPPGSDGEVKPVVFLHKCCSIPFNDALEKKTGKIAPLLWAELVSLKIEVE
jgi:hypothetical protein